jgi:hypothetical protein
MSGVPQQPRMLTVAELHRDREAKARVNHETYKQLLAQVQGRIRARAGNRGTQLVWQVPPLVPGRPVYRPAHAARYVSEKLRRGGFEVVGVAPQPEVQVLYISWSTAGAARREQQQRVVADRAVADRAAADRPGPGAGLDEATHTLEKLKARLRVGR